MGSRFTDSTLALLGGVGVGAALMYLFDPDTGARRRDDIHSSASDAAGSTVDAAYSTVGSARSSAKSLASRISEYAHHLADELTGRASDLTDKAGDYVDTATGYVSKAKNYAQSLHKSARDSASDAVATGRGYAKDARKQAINTRDSWFDWAHDKSDEAISRGKKAVGIKESHPVATTATVTIGTVSVLALGAGAMYFLDPKQGTARREWVRDSLFNVTRQPLERAKSIGPRCEAKKFKGYVAQAREVVESKLNGSWRNAGRLVQFHAIDLSSKHPNMNRPASDQLAGFYYARKKKAAERRVAWQPWRRRKRGP